MLPDRESGIAERLPRIGGSPGSTTGVSAVLRQSGCSLQVRVEEEQALASASAGWAGIVPEEELGMDENCFAMPPPGGQPEDVELTVQFPRGRVSLGVSLGVSICNN